MRKLGNLLIRFAWSLNSETRIILCVVITIILVLVLADKIGWHLAWSISWIVGVGIYLFLLGIVILSCDGVQTQRRASEKDPHFISLLAILITIVHLSNLVIGVVLTSVGQKASHHAQLLIALSTVAVLLSWLLLHVSFAEEYARVYYRTVEDKEVSFQLNRGLTFPGTEQPNYIDFLYVAFTIALTYAMSDVNVESSELRRLVLIHSLVSFLFYSVVLATVLNAIITS